MKVSKPKAKPMKRDVLLRVMRELVAHHAGMIIEHEEQIAKIKGVMEELARGFTAQVGQRKRRTA